MLLTIDEINALISAAQISKDTINRDLRRYEVRQAEREAGTYTGFMDPIVDLRLFLAARRIVNELTSAIDKLHEAKANFISAN